MLSDVSTPRSVSAEQFAAPGDRSYIEKLRQFAARQFTSVKHSLEKAPASGRVSTRFPLRPKAGCGRATGQAPSAFHVRNLVATCFKEEAREVRKRFLAQLPRPSRSLRRACRTLRDALYRRQHCVRAARDRPHAARIEGFKHHRVRHQAAPRGRYRQGKGESKQSGGARPPPRE